MQTVERGAGAQQSDTVIAHAAAVKLVDGLRSQQAELAADIDTLADRARQGNVAGLGEMANLAARKSEVDRLLVEAEGELDRAQETREREEQRARRAQFEALMETARAQRAEFHQLFRDTCVRFGQLCASVEELTRLANKLIVTYPGGSLMMPTDRNRLTELIEGLNPVPAALEAGQPTTGFGYDLRFPVVPVRLLGEKQ